MLIVATFVFWLFQHIILARLRELAKNTTSDIDDTLIEIISSIQPGFYILVAFYLAIQTLLIPEIVEKVVNVVVLVWVVSVAVSSGHKILSYSLSRYVGTKDDASTKASIRLMSNLGKWVLYIVGFLFVLQNLGIDVTSIMAGLGIGGIAIALALQSVLSDLFSSFAIYLDKPFEHGDFIVAGAHMGTVEKIGIKSTRLKALQGEEIVISNKELTTARVQNFKKLEARRVLFAFGVVYGTASEVMDRIPVLVQRVIGGIEKVRFDRAHFMRFGESSLDFEVVYYAQTSDYNMYMDMHQKILLGIKRAFEKESIEMAFPTRTIYTL